MGNLYTKIDGIDKKVSRIFYGTAMKPLMGGGNCNELLDAIYDTGINAFDTAREYQLSEKALGRWIADRHNREDIVLLTKCAHPSALLGRKRLNRKEIRKDWETSAKYLGTDYFDIYLLHRDDPEVPVGEIVEIMNELYQEGKILSFGGSNWTHERIRAANDYAKEHGLIPFTVSSPNFGLAEQVEDPWGHDCVTLTGEAQKEARQWYRENQMPIIAYSSLARGLFSGKMKSENAAQANQYLDQFGMKGYGYPENFERLRRCEELAKEKNAEVSQIALSWMYRQNLNMFAVISTSKAERMRGNIDALDLELTEEECLYLDLKSPTRKQ